MINVIFPLMTVSRRMYIFKSKSVKNYRKSAEDLLYSVFKQTQYFYCFVTNKNDFNTIILVSHPATQQRYRQY